MHSYVTEKHEFTFPEVTILTAQLEHPTHSQTSRQNTALVVP